MTAAPVRHVGLAERRARLATRHRLAPSARTDDVVAIADAVVALHSSDPVSVHLSAAARMRTPSIGAVESALYDARGVVRHHGMRRTLWVVSRDVAPLVHRSSTLALHALERRGVLRSLAGAAVEGPPEAWLDAAGARVLDALADHGPVAARDLGRLLPDLVLPLRTGSGNYTVDQGAHTRLLLLLGFAGDAIRARPVGSWISGQYRWTATASWAPGVFDGPGTDEAAALLVDRWLHAFGPGTTADVRWWTGWTARATTRALAAAGAVPVTVDGPGGPERAFLAAGDVDPLTDEVEPWVALLPGLDPATMGWKQRDWYLDADVGAQLFDRNGNGGPAIWVNGRVVGAWVQRATGEVAIALLRDVGAEARAAIDGAAEQLSAIVGEARFTPRFPGPIHGALRA